MSPLRIYMSGTEAGWVEFGSIYLAALELVRGGVDMLYLDPVVHVACSAVITTSWDYVPGELPVPIDYQAHTPEARIALNSARALVRVEEAIQQLALEAQPASFTSVARCS